MTKFKQQAYWIKKVLVSYKCCFLDFDCVRLNYNLFSNILSSSFFHIFLVHDSSLLQYHAVSTGKQLRFFRMIGVSPSSLSNGLFFWSTTLSRNVGKYQLTWRNMIVDLNLNQPIWENIKYRVSILIIKKQLDALISQIYFWNKTLHVSDNSSVHHQEFWTVQTAVVYVIQVCWQLASCQQTYMAYTIAVCTVKNSWWWTEELSETYRVLFQK